MASLASGLAVSTKGAVMSECIKETSSFSRWNIEQGIGDEILVCAEYHEKGQPCEYRRIHFLEVEAMQKRILELEAALQHKGAEPFDDWPEYHEQGMGCGLEDRGITDRYEAMRYGWDEALDAMADRLDGYTHPQPAVPDGYALVPLLDLSDMTKDMEHVKKDIKMRIELDENCGPGEILRGASAWINVNEVLAKLKDLSAGKGGAV